MRFNPPPGWPQPPAGWVPPPGWNPDPSWPEPPPGWQIWLPDESSADAAPEGGAIDQNLDASAKPPAERPSAPSEPTATHTRPADPPAPPVDTAPLLARI